MITIEQVDGGWIISDTDMEEPLLSRQVVEVMDSESDVEAFLRVLWVLNDAAGPMTSRYSEKRVHITTLPGDKFDD